jgi:hypothetical protein
MTFGYVSVEEATKRGGLRMVVLGGVPSPWGEAAKSILHIKGMGCRAPTAPRRASAQDLRASGGRLAPAIFLAALPLTKHLARPAASRRETRCRAD